MRPKNEITQAVPLESLGLLLSSVLCQEIEKPETECKIPLFIFPFLLQGVSNLRPLGLTIGDRRNLKYPWENFEFS